MLLFVLGCSEGDKVPAGAAVTGHGGGPQSLFFLDPNGDPCMMQGRILASMEEELRDRAVVRQIR